MLLKRLAARIAGPLVLAVLAAGVPAPAPAGGPISDMMARRRARQQMRIPPMDQPFSSRPVKGHQPVGPDGQVQEAFLADASHGHVDRLGRAVLVDARLRRDPDLALSVARLTPIPPAFPEAAPCP